MPDFNIILPTKPNVISEDQFTGIYEIEGLYPGYGHTLGNSLRRIIISSIPGYAVTTVKIDGVNHEFSTIEGVKEDVISIILNLKKVRFKAVGEETHRLSVNIKGAKELTAKDITLPGQIEIVNPDQHIASLTDKNSSLNMEITVEKGLGYVSKEALQKDRVDIGTIAMDASFTPVRRASYEVEQMRVGDRTDFNKLRVTIETDGVLTPREALEYAITTMISQLKAVVGFKEPEETELFGESELPPIDVAAPTDSKQEDMLKTRTEDLNLSVRTQKALDAASIRTVGGLARKTEDDLHEIAGLGEKGIQEIKRALSNFGIVLK
jgi:DNA-directed RNA polymerase subunit alpha